MPHGSLTGKLSARGKLTATLSGAGRMSGKIAISVVNRYEEYAGVYEVTSFCADPLLTTSLVLPTNNKHMSDDVTIYSVPTREENNPAGGVTFIVG